MKSIVIEGVRCKYADRVLRERGIIVSFRKKVLVLCLTAVLAVITGCSGNDADDPVPAVTDKIDDDVQYKQEEDKVEEEETIPDDGHFHGEYVVTGDYAKDRIGAEDALFIDARGWQKAVLGTLKGAIATTWQDLCTCQETVDGWGDDARLVWEFLAAGFADVKMIDGGYAAAKAAGAETQLFASGAEPGEVTVDKIDNTHVMTTEELQENYDDYTIVDVRTDEEYNGAILYNEAQGGHLPGAIHVRYTDLFQEDGTLKPNQELIEMFESAGVDKDDKVVTYCTGGIRSAYTQLVLEMCGYENTWNYDQSFWRWSVVGEVE